MAAKMTDDLLNDDMDFMLSQVVENISFFFLIEIENFRGEGNILMRHTHDTTFFWKKSWKKESEQFFILFLKKMENLRRFFSISEVRGGKFFLNVVWLKYDHFLLLQNW